jgi:hypothetical protein
MTAVGGVDSSNFVGALFWGKKVAGRILQKTLSQKRECERV